MKSILKVLKKIEEEEKEERRGGEFTYLVSKLRIVKIKQNGGQI